MSFASHVTMALLCIVLCLAAACMALIQTVEGEEDLSSLLRVESQLISSWRKIDTAEETLMPPSDGRDGQSVKVVYRSEERQLLLVDVSNKKETSKDACKRLMLLQMGMDSLVKMKPVEVTVDGKPVECFTAVDQVEYMVDNVRQGDVIWLAMTAIMDEDSGMTVYRSEDLFTLSTASLKLKKIKGVEKYDVGLNSIVSLDQKRIMFTAMSSTGGILLYQWSHEEPQLLFETPPKGDYRIVLPFHESGHDYTTFILETRSSTKTTKMEICGMENKDKEWKFEEVPLDLDPLGPLDDTALQCSFETSKCSFFFVAGKVIFNTSPQSLYAVNVFELDQTMEHEFQIWPTQFTSAKPYYWSVVRSGNAKSVVTFDLTAMRAVEMTKQVPSVQDSFQLIPGTLGNDLIISYPDSSTIYRYTLDDAGLNAIYQSESDTKENPIAMNAIPNSRHVLFKATDQSHQISDLYTVQWFNTDVAPQQVVSGQTGKLAQLSIDAVLDVNPDEEQGNTPPRVVLFITYATANEPNTKLASAVELVLNKAEGCWPACQYGGNDYCDADIATCKCNSDASRGFWKRDANGKCSICASGNFRDMTQCTTCKAGFTGYACLDKITCFGRSYDSTAVCSGNGLCEQINSCFCRENYFGLDCNKTLCFDIVSTSNAVCSGRGRCVQFDKCECGAGYGGLDCSGSGITGSEPVLVLFAIAGTMGVILLSIVITALVVLHRRKMTLQDVTTMIKETITSRMRRRQSNTEGFHQMLDDHDQEADGGNGILHLSDEGVEEEGYGEDRLDSAMEIQFSSDMS